MTTYFDLIIKIVQSILIIILSYELTAMLISYYTRKEKTEPVLNKKAKPPVLNKKVEPLVHEIDGSYGEGGGQVLRISAALACILAKDISITNIRGGRKVPGLARQHITGIETLGIMAGSTTTGVELKSCEMTFNASKQKCNLAKEFHRNVHSAGSITLVFQAVLPYMLYRFVPTVLTVTGGTDVDFSPQIDYFRYVFLPTLCEQNKDLVVECEVVERGWNPTGGGKVELRCTPPSGPLKAIRLTDRGAVRRIDVYVSIEGSTRWKDGFFNKLEDKINTKVHHIMDELNIPFGSSSVQIIPNSVSNGKIRGVSILFVLTTTSGVRLASGGVGKVRLPRRDANQVDLDLKDDKVIDWLVKHVDNVIDDYQSGTCVDKHMQDQLIIFMALAQGVSSVLTKGPLTEHTTTAIHLAERLTGAKFTQTSKDGLIKLECKGIS